MLHYLLMFIRTRARVIIFSLQIDANIMAKWNGGAKDIIHTNKAAAAAPVHIIKNERKVQRAL